MAQDSATAQLVEIDAAEMQKWQKWLGRQLKGDGHDKSSSIFRVPKSLLEINKEAYQPQIVSIGPYHYGKDIQMIKGGKQRYLLALLQKVPKEKSDDLLKSLLHTIVSKEDEIRQSYSGTIDFTILDLAKMMVLDGVFLIELFRKFGMIRQKDPNDHDPIFKSVWVLPFLMRDFLRIENQIPFFVLEELYNKSRVEGDDDITLPFLIVNFFNYGAILPTEVLRKFVDLEGKHLLDIFRQSFMIKQENSSTGNDKPGNLVDRPNQDACIHKETVVSIGNGAPGNVVDQTNDIETVVSIGNETQGHVVDRPSQVEGCSLMGNEGSDDDMPRLRIHGSSLIRDQVVGSSLMGNEGSDDDEDDDDQVVGSSLMGNEGSDDDENDDDQVVGSSLMGNEGSDDNMPRSRIRGLALNQGSEDASSIERVSEPKKMDKVGAALTRNETLKDDTSIVSILPTKKHLRLAGVMALPKLLALCVYFCFAKKEKKDKPPFERIQPATKLAVAGVKFKKNREAKSFLDIKFQHGVISIPQINLDDFYSHFILNGMIFEQCYSDCSKDFTTYIVFLGYLINTSMDVGLLSDKKIIQNYLGTDKELVKFFNNVVKYVAFNIKSNYLKDVFKEINDYCDNGWHVGWAGFKHTYFDSPWTFISAFAAFVLLCLAGLQTFYTVYPYYYEQK